VSSPVTPDQTSEPVLIAHAVTVILAAVVSLGWVAIPNDTIDLVGTGVALLVSTVVAVVARGKVTPVAKASTLDAAAIRLLVAEVVRTELATLSAYRAATDTPAVLRRSHSLAYSGLYGNPGNVRVDWMGRPSER
jgi:predicted lysophospholipase L1 biosynthesis ABC-type transport system permease subunit